MTITTEAPSRLDHRLVAVDLYRDIHKGIRAELFALTTGVGSLDPGSRPGRVTVADRVRGIAEVLVSHAEHEDAAVQPALEQHLPSLAERIETDHATIDARIVTLQELAGAAVDAADPAGATHRLYLEVASFTGAYLEHQDVEERVVMPALEQAIGVDAVLGIHGAIISSIPPDELALSLSFMLPAMNVDNRAELLGGMRATAPAPVFEGVWGLATSVLQPADVAALAARLGLD